MWRVVFRQIHLISVRDINFAQIEFVTCQRLWDDRFTPVLGTLPEQLLVVVDLGEASFKRNLRNVVIR